MRHLPLFFAGRRWVPSLAGRSALKRLENLRNVEQGNYVDRPGRPAGLKAGYAGPADRQIPYPELRVALFLGCLINYVYPEIAEATVNVLGRLGVEVVIPQGQVCCGTPVLSFGDEQAARRLATMNTEALLGSGADHIVTACASCGRTLKSDYGTLVPKQGEVLSKKVLDVSELLDRLPARYTAAVYQEKCQAVYTHVYDAYYGGGQSLYAVAA
jgi:glycolate oxidase iron-sulfur subunit